MSYNTDAPARRGYESSPVLTAPALDESWTRLLPNPPPPPFDPMLAQMLNDQANFMGDSVYQLFYSNDPGLGPVPDEPGWQGGAGMTSPGAESSASHYDSVFSPAPSQCYTGTPMTEYSPNEFPSTPTYLPAHYTPAHTTSGPSGSYAPTPTMEAPFSNYTTPITPSSSHALTSPTTTGPIPVPVVEPPSAFEWRCPIPGCRKPDIKDKRNANSHIKTHLDRWERELYWCDYCDKNYLRSHDLKKHMERNHPQVI